MSELSFALGAKSAGQGDTVQRVELTNKGSGSCTMDGFPGLDLVGTANGQSGYKWPLERSNDGYSKITLQPGDSAHFSIKYLAFEAGGGTQFAVSSIAITPPNTYTTTQLPWSVDVLLQDAATHPGTFLTPLVAGS
ncbi:MAG TPA: DUF4232 domain-containing protein [Actinospica sp.]|nr:DUF4232 domain-containing protein [Actinospica sp.]